MTPYGYSFPPGRPVIKRFPVKQELQATGIGFAALILAYPGLVTDMAGKIKDPVGISSQVSDRSGQPGSRAAGHGEDSKKKVAKRPLFLVSRHFPAHL